MPRRRIGRRWTHQHPGPGASYVRRYADFIAADQRRKGPPVGRDDDGAAAIPAGRADHRQLLKGYEAAGWIGFGVPKGTPPEIIATLNQQTNAAVLDPNIKQQVATLGAVAVPPNSPGEFAKFIAENIDKWTKVIKFAGIKPQ